jgi:sodium-independent sulfate anion transporter 11
MISMIEIHEIIEIYKTKRLDAIPLAVTFFVSLWVGLEFGILAGVGVNVCMILYTSSRPKVDFEIEMVSDGISSSLSIIINYFPINRLMTTRF